MVNLDSRSQVHRYGRIKPGSSISVRVNQGTGAGHHTHVITGGPHSKFGIHESQLHEVMAAASQYDVHLVGLHQHIGSNVLDEDILIEAMRSLLATARQFPDLQFVDIGGGLGVPYAPYEQHLDLTSLGPRMTRLFEEFCRSYGRLLTLILEPGRYLVAEAGILLAMVTDVKRTLTHTFVGIDTGFNHLIRPAMYGTYYPIVNASRVHGATEVVWVVGNLCESGNVFARDRDLARCDEEDILAIFVAGAYGFSMSSQYNFRTRPAEVMVRGGQATLIRAREEMLS
jgi:diaminopimelate decarboxylase